MLASKKTKRGVIGAVVLAGVLAISGFALTNALTVTDVSNAGDGLGTIATVAVSDDTIDYTLNATDPSLVDAVGFTLTSTDDILAGTEVWIQLVDTPTSGSTADEWIGGADCVVTGAPAATVTVACDTTVATGGSTTNLEVEDIDQFRVVVAD